MSAGLSERAAVHEAGHCAAALTYGIPIIRVTIAADVPHLLRGHYRAPLALGLESLATLCLAGPAAETYFCGPIEDGSDKVDVEAARRHLARRFDPLTVEAEIVRGRDAAERLVRSEWAQRRIRLIAAALLEHGNLTGDELGVVIAADARSEFASAPSAAATDAPGGNAKRLARQVQRRDRRPV